MKASASGQWHLACQKKRFECKRPGMGCETLFRSLVIPARNLYARNTRSPLYFEVQSCGAVYYYGALQQSKASCAAMLTVPDLSDIETVFPHHFAAYIQTPPPGDGQAQSVSFQALLLGLMEAIKLGCKHLVVQCPSDVDRQYVRT
jgi:hypothetical protein